MLVAICDSSNGTTLRTTALDVKFLSKQCLVTLMNEWLLIFVHMSVVKLMLHALSTRVCTWCSTDVRIVAIIFSLKNFLLSSS